MGAHLNTNKDMVLLLVLVDLKWADLQWADLDILHNLMVNLDLVLLLLALVLLLVLVDLKWVDLVASQATNRFSFLIPLFFCPFVLFTLIQLFLSPTVLVSCYLLFFFYSAYFALSSFSVVLNCRTVQNHLL